MRQPAIHQNTLSLSQRHPFTLTSVALGEGALGELDWVNQRLVGVTTTVEDVARVRWTFW
jgi:hypothetical protein